MREIVLDTETTGLDPLRGDRLVEIGCVEIFNRMPTGQSFHRYFNPERSMPAEAFAVHGLSDEFLADKPFFHELVDEFLAFIGDSPLVIHNASFDIGFINAELDRVKRSPIPRDRLVDTLLITGCSTSACIRATATDAKSFRFRPIIVRECVGDRSPVAHEWTLFDIQARFADVVGVDEA